MAVQKKFGVEHGAAPLGTAPDLRSIITSSFSPSHGILSRSSGRISRMPPFFRRPESFHTLPRIARNISHNIRPLLGKVHSVVRTESHRACSNQHNQHRDSCFLHEFSYHPPPACCSDGSTRHIGVGNLRKPLRTWSCASSEGCHQLQPLQRKYKPLHRSKSLFETWETLRPGYE